MQVWIVSGGALDDNFAADILIRAGLRRDKDKKLSAAPGGPILIGADRGGCLLYRLGFRPDYLIGDFDSTGKEDRRKLEEEKLPLIVLPTRKDDTDTEAALNLALLLDRDHYQSLPPQERKMQDLKELPVELGSHQIDSIVILGATGSRLDHVLGSIAVLGQALGARAGRGIPSCILDPRNRIRLVDPDHPLTLAREDQWGTYLSLIPFGGPCRGVTLRGTAYPLEDADLDLYSSRGVSNEIVSRASLSLREGCLLLIESQD